MKTKLFLTAFVTLAATALYATDVPPVGSAAPDFSTPDANGKTASKPVTLEVGPPPPPLSIKTESLPQALQGFPYSAALEASGGVGPYSWSIDTGTLPEREG